MSFFFFFFCVCNRAILYTEFLKKTIRYLCIHCFLYIQHIYLGVVDLGCARYVILLFFSFSLIRLSFDCLKDVWITYFRRLRKRPTDGALHQMNFIWMKSEVKRMPRCGVKGVFSCSNNIITYLGLSFVSVFVCTESLLIWGLTSIFTDYVSTVEAYV